MWGWCCFGSIENRIIATQLWSITTTHTHIYITLFLETCFFCSQRQWCVKCVAQDGRGTPSLKGLDVFVFFFEKLRVSGAQFVWIIQASVPNGFHGSEGENAQKKKGVSTINIYLSAFPLFCFVIANWIKDLLRLIIEFKAAVCFLSCLKFDRAMFLFSLGRDELIWRSSALPETFCVFEPAPWINVLINKIWVAGIRAGIPNATKSVTVSSFYWSLKKKKPHQLYLVYTGSFSTPYQILGFQLLYISEQFEQMFYLSFYSRWRRVIRSQSFQSVYGLNSMCEKHSEDTHFLKY